MEKLTISKIAKQAGVSIATVSRVLNGKTVRPLHKEKVLEALRILDYQIDSGIRKFRGEAPASFAILVPDLSNLFFAHIANSAVLEAQKQGKNMLVFSCSGDQDLERSLLKKLAGTPIEALLYCPISSPELPPDLAIFNHIPLVIFGRRNILPGRPHVYTDNIRGGYIATKYLRRLGRKQIIFLLGSWRPDLSWGNSGEILSLLGSPLSGAFSSLDRLEGHRRALEEEGLPLSAERIQFSLYSFDAGYNAARDILVRMLPVDAIIAPNDTVAAGVMRFLEEQHIKVPEEISVIGYDDSTIAQMTTPTLTSIRQDPEKIGSSAVHTALRMLKGETVEDVVVNISLSVRKSTCNLPARGD